MPDEALSSYVVFIPDEAYRVMHTEKGYRYCRTDLSGAGLPHYCVTPVGTVSLAPASANPCPTRQASTVHEIVALLAQQNQEAMTAHVG